MASAASGLRESGATVHEKANQRAGEQQGAWRRLTAQQVGDEEGCAKLSTGACRRRGRSSVEGSVWWRRDSGKRQNGLVVARRGSWHGEIEDGSRHCVNFAPRRS